MISMYVSLTCNPLAPIDNTLTHYKIQTTMNSRRQFLSTSGATVGGLLLSPILSQIKAQAAGTKLPPRFVFLVEGNGLEPPHVTPIGYKRPNVSVGKPKVPNMQGVTEMVDESLVGKDCPNHFIRSKPGRIA